MNKHIKYLFEKVQKFDVTDYNDDIISTQDINNVAFNYQPKTKLELMSILISKIDENSKNPYFLDINTSCITDMSSLFCRQYIHNYGWLDIRHVENLDLSTWDTSNVTTMERMFWQCQNLKTIDISSFTTEKLVSVRSMFFQCINLETIDISSFKNVYYIDNFASMFFGCYNLKEIKNINNWKKVDYVSDMTNMFFNVPDNVIPDWYK